MASSEDESSDYFRIYYYKIRMCSRSDSDHSWRRCPYAHPDEEGRRRDHNQRYYSSRRCQAFMADGVCPKGEECGYAHGDNEANFHPDTYRTLRCRYGRDCYKPFCNCAHNDEQDRSASVRERQLLRRRCNRQLRYGFVDPPLSPGQQFANQLRFPTQLLSNGPRFPPQRFSNEPKFPHRQFLNQLRLPSNSVRILPPEFWRRVAPPQPPNGPRDVVDRSLSPPVGRKSTNIGVDHHNQQQQHQPDLRQDSLDPQADSEIEESQG